MTDRAIDLEDLVGTAGNPGGGGIPANFDAAVAPNDEAIEQQFAVVCMEQAETYWNLITSIKPSSLHRLTKFDNEIMEAFETSFPELAKDDERLKIISEDEMKSPDGKSRWRAFMAPFDKTVDDYNFGTLMRANCEEDYSESNSIFGLRLQFYAIEIARNRRGLNDLVWEQAQAEKKAKSS